MKQSVNNLPVSKLRALTVLVLLLLCCSIQARCQRADTTMVRIETRDGNKYLGKILEVTAIELRVETNNVGIITLNRNDIVSIDEVKVSRIKGNVFWIDNPQATRHLWAPNGYGLKAGEGYYQNIWVLFNHFSVGITDNFSMGAGVIPLFLFFGGPTPVWVTPKFSIPVQENQFNIGIGGVFGTIVNVDDSGFGLLFSHFTFGNRDRNVTFGAGMGYADGEFGNAPAFSLAANIRTGPRGYLITENYYLGSLGSDGVIMSFGGRRIINRVGLDFGFILPLAFTNESGSGATFIPWLGFTAPFGKTGRKQ